MQRERKDCSQDDAAQMPGLCDKRFSVRLGTAMEASKLSYQVWAMATYLMMTGIRGVSSMKLHRDLDITQKTAWFLAHRLREAWSDRQDDLFSGPVEIDETYIGGREANKHASKKTFNRGTQGKATVMRFKGDNNLREWGIDFLAAKCRI